ncbi:putative sulfate adenylyltransferase [Helianthus anomalus]
MGSCAELSEGCASPLTGFKRESEFLQTLHFNSLRLGYMSVVNMSVPIVLDIDNAKKERIYGLGSTSVVPIDGSDNLVAILIK